MYKQQSDFYFLAAVQIYINSKNEKAAANVLTNTKKVGHIFHCPLNHHTDTDCVSEWSLHKPITSCQKKLNGFELKYISP